MQEWTTQLGRYLGTARCTRKRVIKSVYRVSTSSSCSFIIFTSLHTQLFNGHALFLHLSTLASFSNFVFLLGKLFFAARVSARLGLRLTNDFEIDSDAFTSHGKPAEGTTKISAEQSSTAQQSKPGSNPVCSLSLSLSLTIKRSIAECPSASKSPAAVALSLALK